jgi:hypothetical protein
MIKFAAISLDNLVEAPWRFTAADYRQYCRRPRVNRYSEDEAAKANILASLKKDGQLAPIHVRPLEGTQYQILDGHVVVECARKAGFQVLEAVVHPGLSDTDAHKRYLYFNLNRARHYHVKLMRDLKVLFPSNSAEELAAAVAELCKVLSFSPDQAEAYLSLDERGRNWRKWTLSGYFDIERDSKMTDEEWDQLRVPGSL